MNKYYTPNIEEFHVGFEYEIDDTWGSWIKVRFKDFNPIGVGSGNDRVPFDYKARVKYLDQEDIESFGFEVNKSFANIRKTIFTLNNLILEFYINYKVQIYKGNNGFYNCIFDGKILNKSELKKVLQQIEYDQ